MSRIGILICCVALAVVAMPRAASAAVNASLALIGPNPLNATCPVTVTFTGAITGPAGTAVTYTFSHFVNGASVISAPTHDTIPASGSLAIAEALPIDQAHSGFQSNEVDVSSPNAAQGKVFFTVNCITPGGSPSPGGLGRYARGLSGHTANELVYGIPIPENLKSTTDPHECGTHGGLAGLFCQQAVPDRYLILVWDWTPNDRWPKIDGYHIYDVTGGANAKIRVQDQTNPQATIEFFKPGSFTGKCYAVTAYKGTTESLTSASFCSSAARIGVRSLSLSPTASEIHGHLYCHSGFLSGTLCPALGCSVLACIGWLHETEHGHLNDYRRTYLQFDPSQIAGRNVRAAKLQMKVSSGDPNCFGGIGTANGPWIGTGVETVVGVTLDSSIQAAISSSGAVFDVTQIVREWANGAPNNGFVLVSTNENTGADDNGECDLEFSSAALGISFY